MNQFFKNYLGQFNFERLLIELLNKALSLVLVYIVFLILNQLLTRIAQKTMRSAFRFTSQNVGRQKTLIRLAENVIHYTLYFILCYWVLTIFGLPVSSLLAGAGIAGVAIGLGAQGFLSDLVNGFFILLERQYDVGDSVKVTNGSIRMAGTVVSFGLRTTQIRDVDGTLHFIPNRNILVVSNQSRGDMRAQIDLPLGANADLNQVREVIEGVNQAYTMQYQAIKGVTIQGPQVLASGRFVYRVDLIVENGQQTALYHTFYGLYQEALVQAGVDLAEAPIFPTT
ncbi:mechanosensitive ion channel family protein [Streptococcus sp. DD13]|uniref:mechanosensitive ion channel family protein n=1 Tax=Streptococcus sp. DD13 TaxID=1777881 RepID=UPI00082BD8C4|nr:mechanosensitive ion channel family protein [Streptococcus sp. DD13]